MNVLLLTYFFPPSTEVGGRRARKVAESFLERGHSVHVVTAPLDGGAEEPARTEHLSVHRIEPALSLRTVYHRIRPGRDGGSSDESESRDSARWKPPERSPFLKRQISSAMWLPDDRQGWIRPAARLATDLVRKGDIDLIYSTAPPFSVHLAALLVKRRTGLRWVAEFRDPWTDNPWKPVFVRSRWSDAVERWLEQITIRRADAVVTVTEAFAEVVRTRLADASAHKVIVVRNGIDELDTHAQPPRRPVLRIVYLGSLYQDRDPRPFLRALAAMRDAGDLPEGLTVDFIGDCRWLLGTSIEDYVHEVGLDSTIRFTDYLPHEQCIDRIRDADLLLLLAQNQPLQVPNKLYEYLGTRRPVLAFADPDGETARLLRAVGGHFIVDRDDPGYIGETVRKALLAPRPAPDAGGEDRLCDWTSKRQFASLHAQMDSVLK